jgi:two-component system OmpR family sensor kinase
MSLRTRLTIIYGLLLAVVFIGLGLGAEILMQGRFSDQARSGILSAASKVQADYSVQRIAHSSMLRYQLPDIQQPFTNVYLELVDPSGKPVDESPNLRPSFLPIDQKALNDALSRGRESSFEQVTWQKTLLEIYYSPMPVIDRAFSVSHVEPAALVVGKSESDLSHALDVFNAALISGEALVWLLAVGVTWLVSGSALRPIRSMTEQAAKIAEESDFAGRVPEDSRTNELLKLAQTFNRMLSSLQVAYANQQRFLADASHELRTPLTVVQGNLHYLVEAIDAPQTEREEALHAARLEADRMGVLVSDLLALSQADAGLGIRRERVELDRVIIEGFRRIQARERSLHPDQVTQMHLGRLDEVVVDGDPERLLQLVVILLDNAAKYTPSGGAIEVELVGGDGSATVCVSDSGEGISVEDELHVFDRFYRSNSSHAKTEGSGLGLAIAKWIAEAHGGTIEFAARPEGGTKFSATIPARMPELVWD